MSKLLGPILCDCSRTYCQTDYACPSDGGSKWKRVYDCKTGTVCSDSKTVFCGCW